MHTRQKRHMAVKGKKLPCIQDFENCMASVHVETVSFITHETNYILQSYSLIHDNTVSKFLLNFYDHIQQDKSKVPTVFLILYHCYKIVYQSMGSGPYCYQIGNKTSVICEKLENLMQKKDIAFVNRLESVIFDM